MDDDELLFGNKGERKVWSGGSLEALGELFGVEVDDLRTGDDGGDIDLAMKSDVSNGGCDEESTNNNIRMLLKHNKKNVFATCEGCFMIGRGPKVI
jgi:hypothetical protein